MTFMDPCIIIQIL